MDSEPQRGYKIRSSMFLFRVCGGCYRYQERPPDDSPIRAPQLSDIYIQKWAMGGHPPEELSVVIQWPVGREQCLMDSDQGPVKGEEDEEEEY